ncbi:MAG: hypothetical protein ACYTG3_01130 [Planctomycetota bacterium]
MASFKRTQIPRGLSAAEANRLIRAEDLPVPLNGKAIRGAVLAAVGLACVLALPLRQGIATALIPTTAVAPDAGPAGTSTLSPFFEMLVIAVALTGLLVAALAIVDGVFGWMEIRAGQSRGAGFAAAAVAVGACALFLFFWSFYFPT